MVKESDATRTVNVTLSMFRREIKHHYFIRSTGLWVSVRLWILLMKAQSCINFPQVSRERYRALYIIPEAAKRHSEQNAGEI